jgi:hypothetical protein
MGGGGGGGPYGEDGEPRYPTFEEGIGEGGDGAGAGAGAGDGDGAGAGAGRTNAFEVENCGQLPEREEGSLKYDEEEKMAQFLGLVYHPQV